MVRATRRYGIAAVSLRGRLPAALAALAAMVACAAPGADYDVVIRGGSVYDGSGDPPRVADVARISHRME
ncbi:hypothetical protein [Candidatus Palauibacter sp.]|uniref:hypothetical protein n=1 Tax=Candidatus Palauibacter sp. TaxID=3101350 RepID=UPI003B5B84DA